ncbi:MAG: exopolysaccharide biosynthesis GT4 family glycosyltransferase EpsE [Tepidisphaeraceae bacterium]
MPIKLGYLVPSFPGQTHAFFWRELAELEQRGVEVDVVSTKLPPKGVVSHQWSRDAMARTTYLSPMGVGGTLEALGQTLRAGPRGWARCVGAIAKADGVSMGGRLKLAALALVGARLAGIARKRGWMHVHAHSCGDAANLAMFARLLSGIPYSVTLHGVLRDYGPNQRQKWANAAFGLLITRKLTEDIKAVLPGSLPRRLDIAPMGVDLNKARRGQPYEPWTGQGPYRIFACGRLNPCKGYEVLIRAVSLLRQRGVDAQLHIAGEDDHGGTGYRKDVEGWIARHAGDGSVTLLGAVSEPVVLSELENAHVFVQASNEEALGVAIMEAMAMRTPVVVTRVGGVPELVESGVDGLMVEANDPEALAGAIEQMLRDPALAARLADAGHRKISERFHSGIGAEVLIRNIEASVSLPASVPVEASASAARESAA